jgi:hypothetical protein
MSAGASLLLALAVTAIVPSLAAAQQPASPPPAAKHDSAAHPAGHDMDAMMADMEKSCPMMKEMHHPAGPMPLTALATPETAKQLAAFTRNYYEALIAKGFSKDEALKIIMSVAIPAVNAAPPPMAH